MISKFWRLDIFPNEKKVVGKMVRQVNNRTIDQIAAFEMNGFIFTMKNWSSYYILLLNRTTYATRDYDYVEIF